MHFLITIAFLTSLLSAFGQEQFSYKEAPISNYVNYLQTSKGLSGSEVWNYIINSASSGRDGVDALFKL